MTEPARPAFSVHRAQPVAGPGVPDQPADTRRRKPNAPKPAPEAPPAAPAAPVAQEKEQSIPIADVITLLTMDEAQHAGRVIKLFSEMSHDGGRMTLNLVHRMWPELFQ